MASDWDDAIARFRECADGRPAQQAYLDLLVGAQVRWEDGVRVHPWRLDVLVLLARAGSDHQVWIEHRVRDGMPILVFKLGPAGTINSEPVVTGDICRVETGPVVLDAFLLQIAQPRT